MRLLIVVSLCLMSALGQAHIHTIPLDLNSNEYRQMWKSYKENVERNPFRRSTGIQFRNQAIKQAIEGGERLLNWVQAINEARPANQQIFLTDKTKRKGIPIDKPKKYGPETIRTDLATIFVEVPQDIVRVVYSGAPIQPILNQDDATFIKEARKINKLYQTAVRWQSAIEPWLWYYEQRSANDVRGYFYLKKLKDAGTLDTSLDNFANLTAAEQTEMLKNVKMLCRNHGHTVKECDNFATTYLSNNDLKSMKDRYWGSAKKVWDSYFKITNPRVDIKWKGNNKDLAVIPFVDPKEARIANFLKLNVEEEFQWKQWQLEVDFVLNGFSDTAKLQFRPGVVPHVTGGNLIVMDKNDSIDEYEVQWTIRHEFGHILRFPDCYVEFYSAVEKVAVNYQLDTTDLMCSRAGDMNERIYEEMKRVYLKN